MRKVKTVVSLLAVAGILLMLLPTGKAKPTAGKTASATSSTDTVSAATDPNAPLTEDEITRMNGWFDLLNETDCASCQTDILLSLSTGETSRKSFVQAVKGQGESAEVYQKETVTLSGKEIDRITYFKGGRVYYINRQGNESEGFYSRCSFEELFTESDTDSLMNMRDVLPSAEVTRTGESLTVCYGGSDEAFLAWITASLEAWNLIPEGFTPTSREAFCQMTFEADGKLTSFMEQLSFEGTTAEGEDITGTLTAHTVYLSYGDENMEVPVPENLDSYPSISEYFEEAEEIF